MAKDGSGKDFGSLSSIGAGSASDDPLQVLSSLLGPVVVRPELDPGLANLLGGYAPGYLQSALSEGVSADCAGTKRGRDTDNFAAGSARRQRPRPMELPKVSGLTEDLIQSLLPIDDRNKPFSTTTKNLRGRIFNSYNKLKSKGFTDEQFRNVGISGGLNSLSAVVAYYDDPSPKKPNFSIDQLVKIAGRSKGADRLGVVLRHYEELVALGFNVDQIIKIMSHMRSLSLISLKRLENNCNDLKEYGFSIEQITDMCSNNSGMETLMVVLDYCKTKLPGTPIFTTDQIKHIASHNSGGNNLRAVLQHYKKLEEFGFEKEQIIKMVSFNGGSKNLEAVIAHYEKLKAFGLKNDQIVNMVSFVMGSKNLEAVAHHYTKLSESGCTINQIITLASSPRGSSAIENMVSRVATNKSMAGGPNTFYKVLAGVREGSKPVAAVASSSVKPGPIL